MGNNTEHVINCLGGVEYLVEGKVWEEAGPSKNLLHYAVFLLLLIQIFFL